MNKLPFILSSVLALSSCKAEEVTVENITTYNAQAVSEILEVKDAYLRQTIPAGYVPESCSSITVPGPYADPTKAILYTSIQMTCTQKYGEMQYLDIGEEIPDNLYNHGVVDVTEYILINSEGVERVFTAPSGKFNTEIGDMCSFMADYLSACIKR